MNLTTYKINTLFGDVVLNRVIFVQAADLC